MKNMRRRLTTTDLLSPLVAVILLVIFSPLFLILAFLVKKDDGPTFYIPNRVGKDGKIFKCFKFRTMYVDADKKLPGLLQGLTKKELKHWRETCKLPNDPRLTKTGKFLRKFSMDELPQIINVVRGDMKFFGPRPIPKEELDNMYGRNATYYTACKPGLSGLAQIKAFGRTTPLPYKRRIALDRYYATHKSLILDCVIALRTLILLSKANNY